MDSPEAWVLVWLIFAGLFIVGEMISPGFYLLPFGISAGAAMILALIGAPVVLQWVVFIAMGAILFVWFIKFANRFKDETPLPGGVGADRLVDEVGPITQAIPAGPTETGRVRLGAEDWLAESVDDVGIADGTVVKVVEVKGTRVIVTPVHATHTSTEGTN